MFKKEGRRSLFLKVFLSICQTLGVRLSFVKFTEIHTSMAFNGFMRLDAIFVYHRFLPIQHFLTYKSFAHCTFLLIYHLFLSASTFITWSVIRQKGEFQNGCFKKTKHAKFSEKRTFLTPLYTHVRVHLPILFITYAFINLVFMS